MYTQNFNFNTVCMRLVYIYPKVELVVAAVKGGGYIHTACIFTERVSQSERERETHTHVEK